MRGCRAGDASGGRAGLEGFEGRASLHRRCLRWSSRPGPAAGSSRSAWSPTRTSCSKDSRTPPRAGGAYETSSSVGLALRATPQHLPPRHRAALVLRDVLGFGTAEAAKRLESSEASVKGRCSGRAQRSTNAYRRAGASAFSMFTDDARSRCRRSRSSTGARRRSPPSCATGRSSAARAPSGARPGQHPAGVRLRPTGRARGDCPPLWTDRADARRRRDRGSHLVHRQRLLRLGAASIAANP
jgi:hypothetical protein